METQSLLDIVQPLAATLSGDHGRLSAAVAWIGSAKTLIMPFANWAQAKLTEGMLYAKRSTEQDDDALVERVLANRAYRTVAFLLKWLTSFKLPTLETWRDLK